MSKETTTKEEVAAVEEATIPEVEQTEDEVQAEVQPASLKLEDLKSLARIVEVSMERGAFRANEASAIGHVYDRLISFVAHSAKVAAEAKGESTEETAEDETPTEE